MHDTVPPPQASASALPAPRRERWQPLRGGLINLFKYDNQEFRYEDGRLLLRGNNGAGKSRVLALQLPFLLDGEIAPHRVEPDGDPAKRMEWNLLMNQHENRLGYTWIEFGRRDPETGEEHFLTLGCGLHARKGLGIPPQSRWFFLTRERIGDSLRLVSDEGVPLTRDRLEAALQGRGTVFRASRDYRAAVDEALFGLGPRYGSLIELLLRLRQPQLSRKLDENVLSAALSEALPPVSAALIENIAQSFRSLEDDRTQIEEFRAARVAVDEFLQTYRHYTRVATRLRAADVRRTHSRNEQTQRDLKRLQQERETKESARIDAETRLAEARASRIAREEEERTLRESPEMRGAEELHHALRRRDELAGTATRAATAEQTHEASHHRRQAESAEAEDRLRQRETERDSARHALQSALAEAGLPPEPAAGEPSGYLDRLIGQREDAARLLRTRNDAITTALATRDRTRADLDRRQSESNEAAEISAAAKTSTERTLDELVRAIHDWETTLQELPWTASGDWRELLESWLDDRSAPYPFDEAVDRAHLEARDRLAREQERLQADRAAREEESRALQATLEALRQGRQPEPPEPPTRDPALRATAPGAPLWKLCGFREDLDAAARPGYEAALEASGLLDAWLTPDGHLLDPLSHDSFLLPPDTSNGADEPDGMGLLAVLTLEAHPGIDPALVTRLLRRIGAAPDSGEIWVSAGGRWRNGPLTGAWSKPDASYLGHAARETARLRRIAALEADLAALDAQIANLREALDAVATRQARLEEERRQAPARDALVEAALRVESAERALAAARARLEEADRLAAQARAAWETALAERDRDAADLALEPWKEPEALERFRDLLHAIRSRLAAYRPAWTAFADAQADATRALDRLAEAAAALDAARSTYRDACDLAAQAAARFDTLHATIGQTVEEVLAQLAAVTRTLGELKARIDTLSAEGESLRIDLRLLQERTETATRDLETQDRDRAEAVNRLELFVQHRLLEETGLDLQPASADVGLSITRAVELARRAEQLLTDTEATGETFTRAQNQLQSRLSALNDQLGMRGHEPRAELIDTGIFKVTCAFQGQDRTMTGLGRLFTGEVADRERMLDAREREVIENHLIGEVATDLQRLLRAGEDWVRDVNGELERRPTSSGIKLRFAWNPDPAGPAGTESVRKHLLKATATWSPAERDAIGHFLQERIQTERTAAEGASWPEQLTRALDYRAWHRFEIERFQEGQWRKLTRRTYGTGSGGEKAMTLTVPQFAAAAAHYRSASPLAPRIILLDEVFVGIDAQTRQKLMGLLDNFDLDFLMTSEREWGCYSTVPALAIYQLASRPEIDAVHVTRWVWNGRERLHDRNG